MSAINVYSEIGKLRAVLLHRPGQELNNLMPDYLEDLLFDDIPFLEQAQKEHDFFAEVLESKGIEILYLEDLAAESLSSEKIRNEFISDFLNESQITNGEIHDLLKEQLLSISDNRELIDVTMAGIRKDFIGQDETESLEGMLDSDYPFITDPMPNLYFTRDNFATMGKGVSLNHMFSNTRNRETIYGQYIFDYHPRFMNEDIPRFYDRNNTSHIEGGDQLILSKDTLAIGISERTDAASIEVLSKNIFKNDPNFKRILAFDIGKYRKFMHLDTVFTMVDYDKFTIHPEIEGNLVVYSITANDEGKLDILKEEDSLENILCKYLHLDKVVLLRCGGGDLVTAASEQWNDGSNTLTIAPGEVVVYDRNPVTNKLLEEAGIKLNYIPGSELVRGRGGPRCMSMPIYRDDI